MKAQDVIYQGRRAIILAERAKGWQRRVEERETAKAALESWMIENCIIPVRYITLAEFRRMYP